MAYKSVKARKYKTTDARALDAGIREGEDWLLGSLATQSLKLKMKLKLKC